MDIFGKFLLVAFLFDKCQSLAMSTLTFSNSITQHGGSSTSSYNAGSLLACAGMCNANPDCGSFAYLDTMTKKCRIFSGITGFTSAGAGQYFSSTSLSNGDLVVRTAKPSPDTAYKHSSQCTGMGLQLVKYPTVMRDKWMIQSHGLAVIYDLTRPTEADQFTTMSGGPVDTALLSFSSTTGLNFAPQCMWAKHGVTQRSECNTIVGTSAAFCQFTP